MLNEICEHLHNFFDSRDGEYINRVADTFTISGGTISPAVSDTLVDGQYVRIVGSLFNDGIHVLPLTDLTDETFDGAIFGLAIPAALVTLAAEIQSWEAANPRTAYTSESFGGWSGTRSVGNNGANITWQQAFARKLNRWRKI